MGVDHHLKIHSNSSGSLSIPKHTYIAPKQHKSTQQAAAPGSATCYLEVVDISQPIDNLPDEVDLSMLEDNPRQQTASDFPLQVWLEDCKDFLREFICLEGHCGITTCSDCKTEPATYHCHNCLGITGYCQTCIMS
ncbi:hypothetical protein JVT61DRAFT_13647 [Boletus reticuloceps]|uniref:Uncharacterized protein n=1 Tax=Boletus reticuloceps TaxID=495285 RepID=A0A8I2YDA6_9AGAM|nr:hypothetical protein JVT61DRAFT_13647 [Boletus reticuloceps]